MAYHDKDIAPEADTGSSGTEWTRPEQMNDRHNRPFRRKAALEAEARDGSDGSGIAMLEPAGGENLPALVEEPWDRIPTVPFGLRTQFLEQAPLVNLHRDDPASKAFDVLRTRLMQALRARGWRRVAIAAPTTGCGTTFTAVNLALSMARVPDSRTVLMDLNMRDPGIAQALDMTAPGQMRQFLKGHVGIGEHLVRCGDTLALGLSSRPVGDASEILQSSACAKTLDEMVADLDPDVVLYDLPPTLRYDDLTAFLPQVDGVLLVANGEKTTGAHIRACERIFGPHAPLLGVVLNRGRASGVENYLH